MAKRKLKNQKEEKKKRKGEEERVFSKERNEKDVRMSLLGGWRHNILFIMMSMVKYGFHL